MPLSNYSVLKGRAIRNRLGTGASPHYQIEISADGDLYRVAINVRSQDGSEVQYLVRSPFEHPLTAGLEALDQGHHPIESAPGGLALDYIRGNLAQPWEFKPLPISAAGPDNDLDDKIDAYVQRAMADERAMVYAFGDTWHDPKADPYFGFKPGQGIHDIHFNQGNPDGRFARTDGPYQDGGLVFAFPDDAGTTLWVAIFLKFQTQAWHTDDASGAPAVQPDPQQPDQPHVPVDRDTIPTIDVPDGLVRIVAALVNDTRSPEQETVTLLNTADRSIDLAGWALLDKAKNRQVLDGAIGAGETRRIDIVAPVVLSNKGGLVTLVDPAGLKVHGVSYTHDQARQPGRTIPFQQ